MKTTIELPDDLVKAIKLHALEEGQKLKDAVARLLRAGLESTAPKKRTKAATELVKKRRAITRKFVAGDWGIELAGYEKGRASDRRKSAERAKAWRE